MWSMRRAGCSLLAAAVCLTSVLPRVALGMPSVFDPIGSWDSYGGVYGGPYSRAMLNEVLSEDEMLNSTSVEEWDEPMVTSSALSAPALVTLTTSSAAVPPPEPLSPGVVAAIVIASLLVAGTFGTAFVVYVRPEWAAHFPRIIPHYAE